MEFPEAVRWLAEQAGIAASGTGPPEPGDPRPDAPPGPWTPAPAAAKPLKPARARRVALADALALVDDAAERLWTPEGGDALAYLKGRGLTAETIRPARLGMDASGIDSDHGWDSILASLRIVIPWSMATAWRWSRSASPRERSRSMPKRSATARRSFRPRGDPARQAAGDRGGGVRRPLARSRAGGPGRAS